MKVSNNLEQRPKTLLLQQNKQYQPEFKGGLDTVVIQTMDAMERGGLFASFMVQDMLGSLLPRPIAGLTRNKKENQGKPNVAMAVKEAIREFTTGPSMFLIPMGILYPVKNKIGKSLDVPAPFIKSLGDIYKGTLSGMEGVTEDAVIKKAYITDVFKNMLSNSTGKQAQEVTEQAASLADDFIALAGKTKKPFMDNLKGKKIAGSFQDAFSDLVEKIAVINKSHSADSSADFLSVQIKNADGTTLTTPIKRLLGLVSDFSDDIIKNTKKANLGTENFKKSAEQFIENFTNNRIVQRFGLNAAMLTATIAFLAVVPKLYNIGKENPALAGLVPANANTADTTKIPAEKKAGA